MLGTFKKNRSSSGAPVGFSWKNTSVQLQGGVPRGKGTQNREPQQLGSTEKGGRGLGRGFGGEQLFQLLFLGLVSED